MPSFVRLKSLFHCKWTLYFLAYFVCLTATSAASSPCPFPAVPYAATYSNVSGGPDGSSWSIAYRCDAGFELFGEAERECEEGEWKGEAPHCATNVAVSKPAKASSEVGAGVASKAVDGRRSTVHEGSKVSRHRERKSNKSARTYEYDRSTV